MIKLFLELKKFAPEFTTANLEKEKIWVTLFPGKEYNYGIMKNLIHDLSKLTDTFISLEFYNTTEYRKDRDLIYSLYYRNLPKLSLAKTKNFEKNFKDQFSQNTIYSFFEYLVNAINVHDLKQRLLYYNNEKSDAMESIDRACEYLVYFFLYGSFIYYQNILQIKLVTNKTKTENLLEYFLRQLDNSVIFKELMDLIDKKSDKLPKTIMCFYYWYKSLSTTDSPEFYFKYKNFLKDNIKMFPVDEWDSLYSALATSLNNIKLPNLENDKETFEINQMTINNKMLHANGGMINYSRFISILENCCIVKEIKFASNFYDEHRHLLPDDVKENIGYYSMARIAFAKSEFHKALSLLAKIQNEPLMLKYYMKNIYMMSYYELKDFESFLYALDSFRHFVKRNKLTNEASQISLSKFGDYIKNLFKLRENFDEYKFRTLSKSLNENKSVHATWLREKLEEIKLAVKKS